MIVLLERTRLLSLLLRVIEKKGSNPCELNEGKGRRTAFITKFRFGIAGMVCFGLVYGREGGKRGRDQFLREGPRSFCAPRRLQEREFDHPRKGSRPAIREGGGSAPGRCSQPRL